MDVRQIIEALGTKATAAATGAVSTSKYFMAYIKQIVTLSRAIKERTDLIPDDPADQSEIIAEIDENEAKLNTLLVRLSAAKSSYLNELEATHMPADLDTLKTRLSDYRASLLDYLTELGAAHIPADIDTLKSRLSAARAANLDYLTELGSAHIPADIDTLKAYCDILDNATNGLANIKSLIDAIITDIASAVPEPPTAKSLQDILHKDTGYTYSKATDALEAIRDRIDTLNTADQIDLDAIIASLNHATYGLDAIKSLLNTYAAILSTLDSRTATIVTDYLAHAGYGLNAILDRIIANGVTLGTLDTRTASIVTDYLANGTWGLNAIIAAINAANNIIPGLRSNLVRWGQIDSIDGNSFVSADLAGLGVDAMPGWWVYVMQADNAAPEGEYRLLTDYANDGDCDHDAFSVALEVGDRVQLLHPSIGMLGQVDTAAAEGAVTTTDFMMAYIKQLVTAIQLITAAGPTKTEMDNGHGLLATPAEVATELETYDAVKRSEATSDKNAIIASHALATVLGALDDAAAEGAVTTTDTVMQYIKQLVTAVILVLADTGELQTDWKNGGRLDNLLDAIPTTAMRGTDSAALASAWTAGLASALGNYNATRAGYLDNLSAGAAALEATLTAIKGGGWSDETLKAIKDAVDAISAVSLSTDWKGSFLWDTTAYATVEQVISALFSTDLAIATRRKYSVKLDLTAVEADGSFSELYLAVKEKIDGSNYRAIDRKTVTKANIAATAEPGIIIEIPATSENVQITMQMETALAGDATIYYAVVKEHLE